MAIIMSGKVNVAKFDPVQDPKKYLNGLFCGYALFWTGISVGISNLVCG